MHIPCAWEPPVLADSRRRLHKGRVRQPEDWCTDTLILQLQGSNQPGRHSCAHPLLEPPELGPPHLCHPSRPRSPQPHPGAGVGKAEHQAREWPNCVPRSWGEVSHPIHPLLTNSVPQVLCHLPSTHSPERLPTSMFLLGGGCLAEGQSSRFWRPPPVGTSALGAGKQGEANVTPMPREPPQSREKGLRCGARLGLRVYEAPGLQRALAISLTTPHTLKWKSL